MTRLVYLLTIWSKSEERQRHLCGSNWSYSSSDRWQKKDRKLKCTQRNWNDTLNVVCLSPLDVSNGSEVYIVWSWLYSLTTLLTFDPLKLINLLILSYEQFNQEWFSLHKCFIWIFLGVRRGVQLCCALLRKKAEEKHFCCNRFIFCFSSLLSHLSSGDTLEVLNPMLGTTNLDSTFPWKKWTKMHLQCS